MGLAIAIVWVYIALRSVDLAFTSDESISYGYLHGHPVPLTANNQWLNTLLMRVSQALFGQAEWALRLPNVLSFAIYSAACVALVSQLRATAAKAVCFAGLMANPFLLEFFGLARGYGLSLAFSAAALAALLVAQRPRSAAREIIRLAVIGATGALAFYSNFSVLNFVLALVATALVNVVVTIARGELSLGARDRAIYAGILCTIVAVMLPGLIQVTRLQRAGALYYGGHVGFVHDTIGTLIQTWGYVYSYAVPLRPWALDLAWPVAGLATLAGAWAAVQTRRTRQWDGWQLASLVLGISVAMVPIERLIVGSLYPLDRGALTYVIGFSALLGFAVDAISDQLEQLTARLALVGLTCVVVALASANVLRVANTTSALTWSFDASARDAIDQVVAIERNVRLQRPLRLVTEFPREIALDDYYRRRLRLSWLQIVTRLAPGATFSTPGGDLYDVAPARALQVAPGTVLLSTLPEDGTQIRAAPGFIRHVL